MMLDQKGDSMICASRVSAKLDFLPLKDGKISVSSAQLFGLNANIYKQDAKSPMNIQFVLDSLASKIPPAILRSTCIRKPDYPPWCRCLQPARYCA